MQRRCPVPRGTWLHLHGHVPGHVTVQMEPRPSWDGTPTLHDLASDTVGRLEAEGITTFNLVGHAFGNRLSRMITADFPERVASLTLLAAGGLVEPDPSLWVSLSHCFDSSLPEEEHLHHVRTAFFAPGNDASVWREGWMPEVFRYQRAAVQATPRDDWWGANVERVLVVQALQDAIAPPGNGRRYVAESAPHARLVEIDGAGHAMLPEQPELIAAALVDFLGV
ncbi:MAG: alpha/beta fold hydrolase, partial [Acidimicrobiales bacterium]